MAAARERLKKPPRTHEMLILSSLGTRNHWNSRVKPSAGVREPSTGSGQLSKTTTKPVEKQKRRPQRHTKPTENVTIPAKNTPDAKGNQIPLPARVLQRFLENRAPTLGEKLKNNSFLARARARFPPKNIQNPTETQILKPRAENATGADEFGHFPKHAAILEENLKLAPTAQKRYRTRPKTTKVQRRPPKTTKNIRILDGRAHSPLIQNRARKITFKATF